MSFLPPGAATTMGRRAAYLYCAGVGDPERLQFEPMHAVCVRFGDCEPFVVFEVYDAISPSEKIAWSPS